MLVIQPYLTSRKSRKCFFKILCAHVPSRNLVFYYYGMKKMDLGDSCESPPQINIKSLISKKQVQFHILVFGETH